MDRLLPHPNRNYIQENYLEDFRKLRLALRRNRSGLLHFGRAVCRKNDEWFRKYRRLLV
jgi:hypothetical protein